MKTGILFPGLAAALLTVSLGTQAPAAAAAADPCWGQATAVFARMGEMGRHASAQPTPRIGLRNLARALYADGVLPDDTLAALGAFVAEALGLTIEACQR